MLPRPYASTWVEQSERNAGFTPSGANIVRPPRATASSTTCLRMSAAPTTASARLPVAAATTGTANAADPNSSAAAAWRPWPLAIDAALRTNASADAHQIAPLAAMSVPTSPPTANPTATPSTRSARLARRIRWRERSATRSPGAHRNAASPIP